MCYHLAGIANLRNDEDDKYDTNKIRTIIEEYIPEATEEMRRVRDIQKIK